MALVDVVIPVFNRPRQLIVCLRSVLAQTFTDFSLTVVDDGSTEDIAPTLEPYRSRLMLTRQANAGASAARNRGASEGSSPYLLFCDADVILKPQFIDSTYKILTEHPQCSFAYTSFRYGWKLFRADPFDVARLRETPYIHTTSLIRRDHFPGFDETLRRFQDWDLYLTMAEQGRSGIWIDEVLFTVQPGGTMSRWLPKVAYRYLPWLPAVRAYNSAAGIVRRKHGLV